MDKLTPKQERFANEYMKTLNVTQSAINAGYSSNSAHVTGSRLLRNEKVKDYIQSKKDKIIDDTILTAKKRCTYLRNQLLVMKLKLRKLWLRKAHLSATQIQDV